MVLKHKPLMVVVFLFVLIYALISLINHYYFRTYALDLGVYTNVMYDYLHYGYSDTASFSDVPENILSDHFDLYLIIFSPFILLFKTYTLLIIQICAIIIGGLGVYKYFLVEAKKHKNLPLFATIFFYSFFGIFSAIAYDYHSNVIAACMVPWLLYFVKTQQIKKIVFITLFIIIGKENISFWLFFIFIALLFENRKDKKMRTVLVGLSAFSFAYFIVITGYIMPKLSINNSFYQFRYSALGSDFFEAIKQMVFHPIDTLGIMFTNHTNAVNGDYIKLETVLMLVFSGLPLLLKKPIYLIMLLPIFAQKFFHDQVSMWSCIAQYNVEFAPILAIGAFAAIKDIKQPKWFSVVGVSLIVLALGVTIRRMDNTLYPSSTDNIRIYKGSHFYREYNVKKVYIALDKIPNNAAVSCQTSFFPHLALRDKIYQFPLIKDAEYIVFSDLEGHYPFMDKKHFKDFVFTLKKSEKWQEIYNEEGFYILKLK